MGQPVTKQGHVARGNLESTVTFELLLRKVDERLFLEEARLAHLGHDPADDILRAIGRPSVHDI